MPPDRKTPARRRICFVTGTRAEFGLMRSTLSAIAANESLELQLIVTGMHLDRACGRSVNAIAAEGWRIDAIIPWKRGDGTETASAVAAGRAIAALAPAFARLQTDIVLVAGDRVEAFAAASAAHIAGKIVAQVHGGDRALGLIDDSLRHAIAKLAHLHFPATAASAERLSRLGENPWRIFQTGSPAIDEIAAGPAPWPVVARQFPRLARKRYALLALHPQTNDAAKEQSNANLLLRSVNRSGFAGIVIVYPNNDPGSDGIRAAWDAVRDDPAVIARRDLPRATYLALLRDAAVLAGNSSSGIIEAASFGTPVLDLGDRQAGRERGGNVIHANFHRPTMERILGQIWNDGRPRRFASKNVYGRGGAGQRIAAVLGRVALQRYRTKLIAY